MGPIAEDWSSMSRYGSVSVVGPQSLISRVVESSEPSSLESLANAAIAALPAGYVIIALSLAGAGDGNAFTVTIEAGAQADVEGGLAGSPSVRCYAAASAEELAIVDEVARPEAGTVADVQVVGSSKGRLFMGLIVLGAVSGSATGPTGVTGPTGTGGGGESMQVGYDAIVAGYSFTNTNGVFIVLPREIVGEEAPPVQVELDGITPGNSIEVSYDISAVTNIGDPTERSGLRAYAVVAFDNPTPVYPGDFFIVANSFSGTVIPSDSPSLGSISGSAAFVIPDGVSNAKIWLVISTDGAGSGVEFAGVTGMFGNPDTIGTGASLRAAEIPAAQVAQAGPGTCDTPA